MNTRQLLQAFFTTALMLFLMAAGARASTITFSTNVAGTGFGGASLTLNNSSGAAATLTYIPNANVVTGVPSNVNLGNFTLACPNCSTQAGGVNSFFPAFTFDLLITDVTDGATGRFVGTSTGGTVFSDVSQITINWAPLSLGPGTNNALIGDFGVTIFSTTIFTGIVAPNSGDPLGRTTVEGFVDFDTADVPEPGTFAVTGLALVAVAFVRRSAAIARG